MTWISFRNFHINLAAKPAKAEYLSLTVCGCVFMCVWVCGCTCTCAAVEIRAASKQDGGGRLVSYVPACELNQQLKGCALWALN